jgi:hypothetical protein
MFLQSVNIYKYHCALCNICAYNRAAYVTRRPATVVFFYFLHASTALVGHGLFFEFRRSHSDTPHLVRLLWKSDQPDAETSTR